MNFKQLCKHWTLQIFFPGTLLRHKYNTFKELLNHDKKCLELITELEEIQQKNLPVDWARIDLLTQALSQSAEALIGSLVAMHPTAYLEIEKHFKLLQASLAAALVVPRGDSAPPLTLDLTEAVKEPVLVGGKAHSLSRVLVETGLPVPRGFVITTKAFHLFLEHNRLRPRLHKLLAQVNLNDWDQLTALSREMADLVKLGDVPAEVAGDISRRLEEYHRQGLAGPWSVRSSALSEDGESSFAGQYTSVLQVTSEEVLKAYKEVLASKYSARAMAYRLRCGLADQETPMAVMLLEMIDATVSGVIYTRAVEWEQPEQPPLALFAICGHGQRLVDGSIEPEVYYLTRGPAPRLLESGTHQNSCLSPQSAELLANYGLILENSFGCPQDIEWCQDDQGACYILQSRPLKTESAPLETPLTIPTVSFSQHPVLLEGGVTASSGIGAGQTYLIRNEAGLGGVPEGAVLVSPTLSPSIMSVIGRLRAVVADAGSQASHFASIAREFGLPVIAGAKKATKCLSTGQNVIVDADLCRVYLGEAHIFPKAPPRSSIPDDSPFVSRLHNLMELVSPLHLIDPTSPDFAASKCQSLHDVVRFAHEKGMAEMFSLVGRSGRGLAQARQVATDLPFTLYVLDLNNSISPESGNSKAVALHFINSRPMQVCWQGLTHPEVVWHKGLVYVDWEEVDRISAGIISLKSRLLASYALIAKKYLHLVLRFGYHFAILDTLCGDNPEANYIAFRFKGGGGDYENRLLRVQLIREVLEWAGFTVITRGDLLEARFERHGAEVILSRLTLWGILQGKTQLLDMSLTNETQVTAMVDSFKAKFGSYIEE